MSENEWRRARSSTTRYKMKENVQTSMNIETLETHSMRSSPIRYSVSQRVSWHEGRSASRCMPCNVYVFRARYFRSSS